MFIFPLNVRGAQVAAGFDHALAPASRTYRGWAKPASAGADHMAAPTCWTPQGLTVCRPPV